MTTMCSILLSWSSPRLAPAPDAPITRTTTAARAASVPRPKSLRNLIAFPPLPPGVVVAARTVARGPPRFNRRLRTCQRRGLALQALRLAEPALHLGAIERLAVEGRSVERRLDLRGERVALRGQALDLTLDRVVGRVARVVRCARVRRRLH